MRVIAIILVKKVTQATLGASINHVDRFWDFFDPSLPLGRQFYYIGLFSKVDIWPTPSPSLVYVVYGAP